jgi:protein-tyrosine phosphatase
MKQRILFVCTGNICRSPLAEAVFRDLAKRAGLEKRFEVDSAGTHGWHEGEQADPRARRVGLGHGVPVTSRAREVRPSDFELFDLIIAMDGGHLRELRSRCPPSARDKIRMLRDGAPGIDRDLEVPDPYYEGEPAFEGVFRMLEVSCAKLLKELRE